MDLQETFDAVVQHLRQQGRRAVDETSNRCVYLAPDGSRCAVGALIPDGHPGQHALGAVEDLLDEFPDLRELIAPTGDHVALLHWLQLAHDDPASWTSSGLSESGRKRLRGIALSYHLDDSITDAAASGDVEMARTIDAVCSGEAQ